MTDQKTGFLDSFIVNPCANAFGDKSGLPGQVKMLLSQHYYNLSDPQWVEQLRDRVILRKFIGIGLKELSTENHRNSVLR